MYTFMAYDYQNDVCYCSSACALYNENPIFGSDLEFFTLSPEVSTMQKEATVRRGENSTTALLSVWSILSSISTTPTTSMHHQASCPSQEVQADIQESCGFN